MEKRPGLLSFPLKKVIIADEVSSIIAEQRSFLNRSGIKILTADSNDEVLKLHRNERADLIIAMLKGPGMNGEELCNAVRGDDDLRRVSMMLICSHSDEDHEWCLRCRANAFVTLPVSAAVLLQEAHHLLSVAPRESLRTEIDVMLTLLSGKEHYPGRSENVSESGMLIATEAVIHEGDTIGCTFSLPGLGEVTTNAVVVRACDEKDSWGANRYGITFAEPPKDMIYAIKVFIRKQRRI